jgi:hypothetical protein
MQTARSIGHGPHESGTIACPLGRRCRRGKGLSSLLHAYYRCGPREVEVIQKVGPIAEKRAPRKVEMKKTSMAFHLTLPLTSLYGIAAISILPAFTGVTPAKIFVPQKSDPDSSCCIIGILEYPELHSPRANCWPWYCTVPRRSQPVLNGVLVLDGNPYYLHHLLNVLVALLYTTATDIDGHLLTTLVCS